MARPLSDEKRKAILDAAARVFAERGIGAAPTAAISRAAGIAEGSLFTYFKTKDELINALYADIKGEIAEALLHGFPRHEDVRTRFQHIWNSYVNWVVAHRERHLALLQVETSGKLTAQCVASGAEAFAEVLRTAEEALSGGELRAAPMELLSAMLQAQMEATMRLMEAHPGQAAEYRQLGFELLWNGVKGK
jgi:AcrR family transcriptional regulator